jgi:hypothetical protein
MDCDHRDPSTKHRLDGESLGAAWNGFSMTKFRRYGFDDLFEELWKCDPVCRPCHYRRGAERRQEIRQQEWKARDQEWKANGHFSDHQEWLRDTQRRWWDE